MKIKTYFKFLDLNTTAAMLLATISGETDEDLLPPPNMRIFLTVVFALLSIMGIIGNLMVVTVVLKVPGMVSYIPFNEQTVRTSNFMQLRLKIN